MAERGKHGNHWKGPRVKRVTIVCETCGTGKEYLPCFLKIHPIRYCSKKCAGIATQNKKQITCNVCNNEFKRRPDKIKEKNYCSKECSAIGRSVEGAKWKDKEQIKSYMKAYRDKNREKINRQNLERTNKNKEAKLRTQAKYRKENKHKIAVTYRKRKGTVLKGDLTPDQWLGVLEKYNHSCLCCGISSKEATITLDHIKPIAKGGLHTANNVQPLCKSCNSSKNVKEIDYR